MKMKILLSTFFISIFIMSRILSYEVIKLVVFLTLVLFFISTTMLSLRAKLPYYHDFPNVLRMVLTGLGGILFIRSFYVFGFLLFLLSIMLNDEWQRRAFRKIFPKKRGATIAFLGIDGSGKSTHVKATFHTLKKAGIRAKVVPFNKYIFLDKLAISFRGKRLTSKTIKGTYTVKLTPLRAIRPWLSFVDNLLYYIYTSLYTLRGYVIIYDRFIWSTFIKYKALGYPVNILLKMSFLIKPTYAIVLDIPAEVSLQKIYSRKYHLRYPLYVLKYERLKYLALAKRFKYPIIDSRKPYSYVQNIIDREVLRMLQA